MKVSANIQLNQKFVKIPCIIKTLREVLSDILLIFFEDYLFIIEWKIQDFRLRMN